MSPCASFTEHCLWGPGDLSVCCSHSSYDYPELYNFNAVDTEDRQCCFVGIPNEPGSCDAEAGEGRSCGYGCENCDDERGAGALSQYEIVDGQRWLMPSQVPGQRSWDARGRIHDLRSNEYHPIPGRIIYERGTCWSNDGVECFGADACACFGANTFPLILDQSTGLCGGSVPAGEEVPGLLPDEFFRTGHRWPPRSDGGHTQFDEQWYCRQFGETRLPGVEGGNTRSTIVVDPASTGGLVGVTEGLMEPELLSSNVCQSDRMAHCSATLAKTVDSPCYFHSAHGVCTGACIVPDSPECIDACDHTFYSDAHRSFDYLKIDRRYGPDFPPPHIIGGGDDHSQLGGDTAAWKNEILEMVRTHAFPLPPEEGGAERTISFDRLDHRAVTEGNSLIGLFQREWIGTPDTLVKVPGGSGTGRLLQAGCTFDYSTWITRVRIVCRLILHQHRNINPALAWPKRVVPLVRLHIIATTTMTVDNLVPCDFVSARNEQPVGVEVRNEWTGNEYVQVLSPSYGESLMFFNADGRQFIPSPLVEWRGFLGGHSKPTSDEQAMGLSLISGSSCETIAQFAAIVPGWPTNVDTPGGPDGDDPAGTYGGHVVVEFLR